MNVTNYNDSLAGAPSNGEQPSGTDISSTQGQPGPGTFVSSPGGDPRALTHRQYSVKGENQAEKCVDSSVMNRIIEQGTDGFVRANYYTKSIAPHHLVVHNQKKLDFVNWQIENAYIGKDKLECLELLFKPKNIENLPISLTTLKLNWAIDLTGLKKILEHLPKLEEIEFREIEGGFIHLHPQLLSNFKKICINKCFDDFDFFDSSVKDQEAFLAVMVNNKNLHTLQIGSHFELPPGGAERLAKSNIHTLMLATAKSASRVGSKDIDDYKILLGSKTLKSLTLTCSSLGRLSQHLPMLKEEIESCEINNLDIRDNLIRVNTEPYALLGDSRRLVSERKISLLLNNSSWREEFKWILEPKFFQDISIAFGGDLNVSEEFFKLLMVHPGGVQMYLNSPSPDQRRREHSARISECRTLDTLKVYGWDRSDLEKFVGHPKLATLILHSFNADAGLELLKGIPGLNSLYLGSGLTGKMAEGLENNHTIKKIGLEYTALTEDIAKSLVKVLHLSTVDLRRINLSPGSLREEVSALKVLLSAPGITKIYVPIRLRDIFSAPDLVELTRNSSAGRIEFWSDHRREHGPELPPPTTTVVLNPQLLA